jgi:hypothetical protein
VIERQGCTLESTVVDRFSGSSLRRRYFPTAPGLSGEDRDGHDRSRHQRPASAHALSARFRCLLLAFSIVSVGTVIGSLGLPKTVLRFAAEGMTRNQPGRARRAPAWRYCERRAENIRGEREAQLSRIRASSACKALVKLVRGSRPTCTQRKNSSTPSLAECAGWR